MEISDARKELQAAGRYMLENGLAWGNAGNISARTAPDRYIITASGTQLGELGESDFVEVPIEGNLGENVARKPSKEMPMHRAIYQARPEVNAILHASPFYSTLLACSDEHIPSDWFVEDMYYLERVARVPYRHPGSEALGQVVREQAAAANILLLENHGVLVYDVNVREALMGLHTLEFTCRMFLAARSAGVEMNSIPPNVVQDFLLNSGYRPRREWPK